MLFRSRLSIPPPFMPRMARLALLLYGTAVTHATHTVGVVGPNTLCFEDCYAKSDGDCDDGGDGSQYSICSYGNDCVDCGPRFATVPNPTPAPPFISLTPLRAGRRDTRTRSHCRCSVHDAAYPWCLSLSKWIYGQNGHANVRWGNVFVLFDRPVLQPAADLR